MSASKKNKIKIEPFRHPQIDPNFADKTWKVLEDAIHEIHAQNASGLSFEELYRNAYNMVLHKHGDRLYTGLAATLTEHLRRVADRIDEAQGEPFLRELEARWLEHHKSSQMIRDILMYMDRTYVVTHERTPVFALGLNLWREEVVKRPSIAAKLQALCLEQVAAERRGELVDKTLLKSLTSMLSELGGGVYASQCETPFLAASTEHYGAAAQRMLAECDCTEYLRHAEAALSAEVARVAHYLSAATEAKIVKVVEDKLLAEQLHTLVEMPGSGLVALFARGEETGLRRMYSLLKRLEGGHALMKQVLGADVLEQGKGIVTDSLKTLDPISFVSGLLQLKARVDAVIGGAFSGDRSFHHACNQAFEAFILLAPRAPEFLSLFMDETLRKGAKGGEADPDELLDRVMALFRFLQDKDIFERYYKQHLAKRLMYNRVASDESERSLLVKLKSECGYQFTSKLESMFSDVKTSRDITASYRTWLSESAIKLPCDMGVQVLTTGSWPTQVPSNCRLPAELAVCCTSFETFYDAKHHGRKLAWQTSMGTADLKAAFGNGKRHELNVSTAQMCVLLLFNDAPELSYPAILEATGMAPADLQRNLQSLACVKGRNVLRKEPMSRDIAEGDVFSVNDTFTCKYVRVKIGTISAARESEPEKEATRERVEEDRKPQIEAAVVRIMKARRVLDHNTIVSEVTRQLSSRFVPNPLLIKKRIESLIEREFLERDASDRRMYRYLA